MRNPRFLPVLCLPLLLAGCGGSSSSISTSSSSPEQEFFVKEKTEIEFLCMVDGSYRQLLDDMVREFEKEEPNVSVSLTNPLGSGNYGALEKAVVAGFFKEEYPDLVQCYPDNVVKYHDRGYVVNVDTYRANPRYGINQDEDYIEAFLEEGSSYKDKGTYSLPFCKSTELLYYNADVLLGLDLSSVNAEINQGQPLDETYLDNLSWEELFNKLCPAIKTYNDALEEGKKIWADTTNAGIVTYDSDENFFITLAQQYGYGYTSFADDGRGSIDYDNQGMKDLMLWLNQAKAKGYLQTHKTYQDYVSYLFQTREALFTISSTAGLSYNFVTQRDAETKGLTPFAIGVAKLPTAEGKEHRSINQGPSVCVLDHKDENRALASYLLWRHLTNPENARKWSLSTGYIGVRHSVYENEEFQQMISVSEESTIYERGAADNLKKIADVKGMTFNTAVFRGSGDARTNVGLLLAKCLTDENLEDNIDAYFASSVEQSRGHLPKN